MSKIVKFLIIACSLYLAWFILYDLWLMPNGALDQWLTNHVAKYSGLILKVLGYDITHASLANRNIVIVDGRKVLHIAHGCNGLILHALFVGFILAFPGPIKQKTWFILVGMLLIYLLNVARVVALVLIRLHFPQSLDFNHKYTFVLIVYGCIFGLWMLWVNRFSGIAQLKSKNIT